MFSAYVMRRVGTFTLEEKVKMIECISRIAINPDEVSIEVIRNLTFPYTAAAYAYVENPTKSVFPPVKNNLGH